MELVPRLPAGIDPQMIEPGALLVTEPTAGKPAAIVEVQHWHHGASTLHGHEETAGGPVARVLTCHQVRNARLLRPAPNLIDDVLGPEAFDLDEDLAALFARCDTLLADKRAERHAKRHPRLREAS